MKTKTYDFKFDPNEPKEEREARFKKQEEHQKLIMGASKMKLKHNGKEYSVEGFGELSQEKASQIVTEKLILYQGAIDRLRRINYSLYERLDKLEEQAND